jgi:large subunit ribosomal protein L2
MATIGVISDFIYLYYNYNINAGYNRRIGWRPYVRGTAMNAVDHPHGGGKGKKAGKSISMSPWKKLPKGKKTL